MLLRLSVPRTGALVFILCFKRALDPLATYRDAQCQNNLKNAVLGCVSIEPSEPPAGHKTWRAPVEQTVFQRNFTQVHAGWGEQHLVARCAAMEPLTAGQDVYISAEPRHVVVLGA